MNDRTAFSWSSSFWLASENLRSMPSALASSCMLLEKAVRQSLSCPTCEKPIVRAKAEDAAKIIVAPTAAHPSHFSICIISSHVNNDLERHPSGAEFGRNAFPLPRDLQ